MNEKIGMQDLVALLADEANISKKESETFIKECFDIMEERLTGDKLLKIRNLGTFKLVRVEDRESVDVSTGERVLIPAHYKATFSPDIELAEKINAPYASLGSVEVEDETVFNTETDDETENDDETEDKFYETGYLLAEPEKQKEPESLSVESKPEEPVIVESEQEEPVIEEPEEEQKEEPVSEREVFEEEEEEKEPAYPERYEKDYQPAKTNNKFLWTFLLIAFGLILFFAGYYLYPIINSGGGWKAIPDSVNQPQTSNIAETKEQKPDTAVTVSIADTAKVEPAKTQNTQIPDNQPPKKTVNKKHTIQRGERLNTIALREYGHKVFWVYIYQENRNAIKKPDLIEHGMIINIPPAEKYGIDKNSQESIKKALELEQKYK